MSKVTKVKLELEDATALMDLVEILKNIASNHFYKLFRGKSEKSEFEKVFDEFFTVANLAGGKLIQKTENKKTAIIAFCSEGGFMADLTAKIVRAAIDASREHDTQCFIVIGKKGAEKLKPLTDKEVFVFQDIMGKGFYRVAIDVKDKAMALVKEGKIGEIYAVYPRAKSISLIKQSVVKVFPPEDLVAKKKELKVNPDEKLMFESGGTDILNYLSGVWITFKIMTMLEDCSISGYAAQSQQLESSLETLNKMRKKLFMDFRKAKRSEIDKSLREVFSASIVNESQE